MKRMARRTIGGLLVVFVLFLTYALSQFPPLTTAQPRLDGRIIFRYDTFGDEQLWTDVLRMHEAIATVDPTTALSVGLKVDVEALPPETIAALKAGERGLDESGGDDRAASAQRRCRRHRECQCCRAAHEHRDHVRVVPFNGRRFVHRGHRQTPRRMGEHRSECRRDRRVVAGT